MADTIEAPLIVKHFIEIERYLMNVEEVVDILLANNCLRFSEVEVILGRSPVRIDQVRELLLNGERKCQNPESNFLKVFVEALRETNNGLLADLFVVPNQSRNLITEPDHPIFKHQVEFVKYLDNVEEVVDVMKNKKCLTKLQAETILQASPIRANKVRGFIKCVSAYPLGHEVFNGFLAALRETNNGELADAIEPAC